MKKFFFSWIIAICSLGGWAQEDRCGNFVIQNDAVCWEYIYVDSTKTSNDIREYFYAMDIIDNAHDFNNRIIASMDSFRPNYKAAGYTYATVPLYISRSGGFSGKVVIEISDFQYKVTLSKIIIKENRNNALFDSDSSFDDIAYNFKKHRFKTLFPEGGAILDDLFKSKFQIK
ncbi:MAG: hypothetical protein J1E79_02215 [Rikenella sp.]|nr:hypothetical protein [Rikenella sp.]